MISLNTTTIMNWLRSNCILILFGLLFIVNKISAQETYNDENLFYCNENINIKFIWALSDEFFVANAKYKTEGGLSSNLFLLFDKSHLIIDSLYSQGMFLNSLTVNDNNEFVMNTALYSERYKIVSNQFSLIDREQNKGAMASLLSSDFNKLNLGKFYGVEVGYETSAKDRTKKRSKKNIPRYYYINKSGEKQWVNSGKEEVVGDQWKSFLDKPLFELGEVTSYNGEIYFNIPMIGTCYILNTKTLEVKTILYPTEGANSWFLTVDKITGSYYLIGDIGGNKFEIYHVNLKTNKRALIGVQEGFYDVIIDDQILLKKEVSSDSDQKKFSCFYLVPIFSK
jgi:hypothetical protein